MAECPICHYVAPAKLACQPVCGSTSTPLLWEEADGDVLLCWSARCTYECMWIAKHFT